jgi:hypothetical protein
MVASFDNSLCAICRDMGMEVEAAPVQVKVADAEVPLFQDTESKASAKEREEAAVFGADNAKVAANATNDLAPPKDAVEDWPEPKQTYTFYFVKIRSFEDPKLRAKLEQADKDFQNKIQARSKIFEAIKAKKVLFFMLIFIEVEATSSLVSNLTRSFIKVSICALLLLYFLIEVEN